MFLITSACSSRVPWEKFNLAQSMPLVISFSSISGSREEGPMVTMILVFRMMIASLQLAGKIIGYLARILH